MWLHLHISDIIAMTRRILPYHQSTLSKCLIVCDSILEPNLLVQNSFFAWLSLEALHHTSTYRWHYDYIECRFKESQTSKRIELVCSTKIRPYLGKVGLWFNNVWFHWIPWILQTFLVAWQQRLGAILMDINVHVEKVAAKIEQFQNAKLFLVMTSAFQRFIMPHLSK